MFAKSPEKKKLVRKKARKKPRKRIRQETRARYMLKLYITGQTPRSLQSVENLRTLCDKIFARTI